MTHIIAVFGLAALCALWFVIQKRSGRQEDGGAGRCGMCGGGGAGGGGCAREGELCERRAVEQESADAAAGRH